MSQKYFNEILALIYKKSPLQKKKLENYLSRCDESFFKAAEKFSIDYIGYLEKQNISVEYAIDAYLNMCSNILRSQIYFMKTGKYPLKQKYEAIEYVYNNEKEMQSYMVGLALSQFLWPSHYEIFSFFKNTLKENSNTISSYLEIGPGHGLYLREAVQFLKKVVNISVVDISQTSIKMTRSIMTHFYGGHFSKIKYHNIDMLDLASSDEYDFITMGEVLEHVNHPDKLLYKVKELLVADGKVFISTCVNCPAIDHVYHFKSVDEIRAEIDDCSFIIKDERVLPVENLPMKEILEGKITINYCAILGRK